MYEDQEKSDKKELRRKLFRMATEALEGDGWTVERVKGERKSSVRRIKKGGKSLLVAIRTTRDQWIGFHFDEKSKTWDTLSEVDAVVAASVDDRVSLKSVRVHLLPGDEMRDRFTRNYEARVAAKSSGRHKGPVFVGLYEEDSPTPISYVGAGAGIQHPPFAVVPLDGGQKIARPPKPRLEAVKALTISEAKAALALGLGVDPSCVKITVEA